MTKIATRPVRIECRASGQQYEARWEAAAAEAVCARCGDTIPTKGSTGHPVHGGRGRP